MVWSSGQPSLAGLEERKEGLRRARPGDRQGWLRPRGVGREVIGQGRGAHLALSLDTMSWTAPQLGWRTGNSGWQRVLAGSPMLGEQPGPSEGWFLQPVLPPWARSRPAYPEAGRGPGALWGPQQSLPTLGLSVSMSSAAAVT